MKQIRILLADDNPHVLQLLACLLSDEHRIVGTVADGRALITAAAELRPDIVISDIDMPTLDGLEAARQLRQLLPDIKVILMSGHEEAEYVAAAFAAGACAFVSKGKAGVLRTTMNVIIRNIFAQSKSKQLVTHGMAKHISLPSVGKGVV